MTGDVQHAPRAEDDLEMSGKAKILIADDHRMITEAVARLLDRTGAFEAHVVGTLAEAIQELSRDTSYDLVLLDVRMPGMSGLDSVRRVVARAGDAKVALFSGKRIADLSRAP